MDGLLVFGIDERGDAFGGGRKGFLHACARGAADYVVTIERSFKSYGGEKVRIELGSESAQLFEREVVEFDAFLKRKSNGVADFLMRGAEGNALVDEIGCRGHGVEVAGLRGFLHTRKVELKSGGEASYEPNHAGHKLDGECRLLGLLHVFIVGQGQAFELQRDGLRCAVNATDLGADELGEVGVFLLRHGAGAGGKRFGKNYKTIFGGGKERYFFGETA